MAMTADVAGGSARRSAEPNDGPSGRAPSGANRPAARVALVTVTIAAATSAVIAGVPLAAALTVVAMLPAASVDLREHRLPDRLLASAAAIGFVAVALERSVGTRLDGVAAGDVLAGIAATAGPLLALHLVSPAAMGFGDVKAGIVLGFAVGLVDPVAGLLALTIAGGLGALAGLAGRRRSIAFGPPLVVGSALALFIAPWVLGR